MKNKGKNMTWDLFFSTDVFLQGGQHQESKDKNASTAAAHTEMKFFPVKSSNSSSSFSNSSSTTTTTGEKNKNKLILLELFSNCGD
jgi:hypothetical protein